MKKAFFATGLLILAASGLRAQDMDKIRKDFEQQVTHPTGIPYGNNPAAGKYYEIRGFRMYCEMYGEGQPLLIIHGNGGSINNFIYQIPYFAQHYKVIIADSRNQGKSPDPGDSLTYEMMADDYAALLTALKVDSANVIGWSDGGINGLLLAIRHPEKVRKLAITGANLVPDSTAVPQEVWNMVMPSYNMLKAKKTLTEQEKTGWKLLRLLVEQPHIPLADLHTIHCPTLVIGGDHDVIWPRHTLLIQENIPQSYLWILPASGHSTPIVYAESFNREVDHFFSSPFRKITGAGRFF
jgi:pimeloyl-ACP methyl ester carboxylesterase